MSQRTYHNIKTKEETSNGMVVLDSNSVACYSYRGVLHGQAKGLAAKSLAGAPLLQSPTR